MESDRWGVVGGAGHWELWINCLAMATLAPCARDVETQQEPGD